MRDVYLMQRQLVVGIGMRITTVLGSCVSVTMHHPLTGVGGMCHAMLPSGTVPLPYQYVDTSIRALLDEFADRGIPRHQIETKVFGGASIACNPKGMCVGSRNVEVAFRLLEEAGLEVLASDVGGWRGRKVIFATDTGTVLVKLVGGQAGG